MDIRIQITCFAASYAVALALEVSRLLFRSQVRRAVLAGFALAGLAAHTLFLLGEAARGEDQPLSSAFDWYLLAAWVLAACYCYLRHYHPQMAIGLFFLPVVLGLIAVAAFWADRLPFPKESATQAWGMVHGLFLLAGAVAVMFGFLAGLMYLFQAYRLKHKLPPSERFQLPSLEWLQRVNERAIVVSMLMLAAGLTAGVILNAVSRRKQLSAQLPWDDPLIWSSGLMLAWLAAAALFNALYRPARLGRKVAYLTVASFLFLVFLLSVKLFVDTGHRGSPAPLGTDSRTNPASRPLAAGLFAGGRG